MFAQQIPFEEAFSYGVVTGGFLIMALFVLMDYWWNNR